MAFSEETKIQAMVACGRKCCICHRFCGPKIELHHIMQQSEGGTDDIDNCIPLCFDCHSDQTSYDFKHPKGTKYRAAELREHRDKLYAIVAQATPQAEAATSLEPDRVVFRNLLATLPYSPSIEFIGSHNFAGFSFPNDKLDDLQRFYYWGQDPINQFVDPTLENLRVALTGCIDDLLEALAYETFPVATTANRNVVPPEWQYEQPERFRDAVQLIHSKVKECVAAYRAMIAEGRRMLGI